MIDINDASKSKALAGFQDADIRSVYWVNDDRLVYTIVDYQSDYSDQAGSGLFSIDREGSETARQIIERYFKDETTIGTRIQSKTFPSIIISTQLYATVQMTSSWRVTITQNPSTVSLLITNTEARHW